MASASKATDPRYLCEPIDEFGAAHRGHICKPERVLECASPKNTDQGEEIEPHEAVRTLSEEFSRGCGSVVQTLGDTLIGLSRVRWSYSSCRRHDKSECVSPLVDDRSGLSKTHLTDYLVLDRPSPWTRQSEPTD